jgi:hypothetical protein
MAGKKQPFSVQCKVVFQRYLKIGFTTDLIANPLSAHMYQTAQGNKVWMTFLWMAVSSHLA